MFGLLLYSLVVFFIGCIITFRAIINSQQKLGPLTRRLSFILAVLVVAAQCINKTSLLLVLLLFYSPFPHWICFCIITVLLVAVIHKSVTFVWVSPTQVAALKVAFDVLIMGLVSYCI